MCNQKFLNKKLATYQRFFNSLNDKCAIVYSKIIVTGLVTKYQNFVMMAK